MGIPARTVPARTVPTRTVRSRTVGASVATVLAAAALAGCFTTAADFRSDAEAFILDNEDLAEALDTTFTEATCAEPQSQAVGSTFDCDAVDADGRPWEFQIVITATNEYEVNVSRRPSDF